MSGARVSILVDGQERWASDSPSARNQPGKPKWGSSWQGGFTQLDAELLRSLRDLATERPDADIRVVDDSGARTPFHGRLVAMPRSVTRQRQTMSPKALGLQCLTMRRRDAMWLGIDRTLANWKIATLGRQSAINGWPAKPIGPTSERGRLKLDVSGPWTSNPGRPFAVAQYDASPLNVGRVGWSAAQATNASNDWTGEVAARDANGIAGSTALADWMTVASAGIPTAQPGQNVAIGAPVAEINLYNAAGSSSTEGDRSVAIEDIVTIGDHGLTLTGSGPADWGIGFDDAIRDWLRRFCPEINPRNIAATGGLGIQQLAFSEPTAVGEMIKYGNSFHAWCWGVWEDGWLDAGPFGSGRTWIVGEGDGAVQWSGDGIDLSAEGKICTDLVIWYDTPDGKRSVGAPGTICHEEDASLTVTDPRHPLRVAGSQIVNTWSLGLATKELAVQVGQIILAHMNSATRSGSVTLTGKLSRLDGGEGDFLDVRGGDQVILKDSGDLTQRNVMTTETTPDSCVVMMDNDRQTVQAMLAHLGAHLTGVGA